MLEPLSAKFEILFKVAVISYKHILNHIIYTD